MQRSFLLHPFFVRQRHSCIVLLGVIAKMLWYEVDAATPKQNTAKRHSLSYISHPGNISMVASVAFPRKMSFDLSQLDRLAKGEVGETAELKTTPLRKSATPRPVVHSFRPDKQRRRCCAACPSPSAETAISRRQTPSLRTGRRGRDQRRNGLTRRHRVPTI